VQNSRNQDYEFIIEPHKNLFCFDWKGLIHQRDLLFLLVRRDFVSRYKQSILGPFWFVIQPLLTTLVFTIVFGKIVKVPTNNIPPVLFYLCSLSIWNYFSSNFNLISGTFSSNAYIFGKVYFPRLIPPISNLISNFFTFLVQFITFLVFFFFFKFFTDGGAVIKPNIYLCILPVLIIHSAALGLGMGLWFSALTVKYRDFQYLLGFISQLWMYATPIIYPLSIVPGKLRFLAMLNPMTSVVEMFKYAFFGVGNIDFKLYFFSVVVTITILFTGILLFNRTERTFIDTV
jgi:lipopolysaccharide transport system permease protein